MSGGTATAPASDAPRVAQKQKQKKRKDFDRPRFLRVFVGFAYLFLFAPIFVVILFSFNSIKSLQNFEGFSLQWYEEFLNDQTLRDSLFASLEISVV